MKNTKKMTEEEVKKVLEEFVDEQGVIDLDAASEAILELLENNEDDPKAGKEEEAESLAQKMIEAFTSDLPKS